MGIKFGGKDLKRGQRSGIIGRGGGEEEASRMQKVIQKSVQSGRSQGLG